MIPPTRYADRDGVDLAYKVFGEGDRDIVLVFAFISNVDVFCELPEHLDEGPHPVEGQPADGPGSRRPAPGRLVVDVLVEPRTGLGQVHDDAPGWRPPSRADVTRAGRQRAPASQARERSRQDGGEATNVTDPVRR